MNRMPFNKGWDEWYCGVVLDKVATINLTAINYLSPTLLTTSDTAISDNVNIVLYLYTDFPNSDNNLSTPPILVGTATDHNQKYSVTCRTLLTHLTNKVRKGHILPAFNNSLIGIVPFYDADFKVLFYKESVTVFDPSG